MDPNVKHQVVGYVRVSGAGQVNDGDGLGVQREKIEAWSRYQGLDICALEEDAGISGSSTHNRPGLRRALGTVLELREQAVLVVYKLDRLGRSALDTQEILTLLLDEGVRVVALADGIDSGNGTGATILKLLISILSAFAELERSTIRQRLLDGRRRADSENRVYAVEPRYGRRVAPDGRGLVEDRDELRAAERAKELRAAGASYRKVAATLDEEGLRPRRAARWSASVVHRLVEGRREAAKSKVSRRRFERVRAELLGDGAV